MEDEWERELVAEEDLDLLFIRYNPGRVTIAQLMATIQQQGFHAEKKDEG